MTPPSDTVFRFILLLTILFIPVSLNAQPLPDQEWVSPLDLEQPELSPETPAPPVMEEKSAVVLRALDKITGQTKTFEVNIGDTVKFGSIYVIPRSCRKALPIEPPESAAFLQIWEITPNKEAQWIFSNWMFASGPALSTMDHPVYDIWVLDCKNASTISSSEEKEEEESEEQTQ